MQLKTIVFLSLCLINKMRVFLAVELPEHAKSKVFHQFENLRKKNLFNGKFVEKQNLHLTLKFFGEITEEKIEKIKKTLKEINFKSFSCEIGKTGFFDDEKHIKVIWVDLISDKLNEIQKEIAKKFPEFYEDKGFSSHITLARVKSIINKEELIKEVKKINFKKLDFSVKEVVLMKSGLFREGPKYKIIERFKLKN